MGMKRHEKELVRIFSYLIENNPKKRIWAADDLIKWINGASSHFKIPNSRSMACLLKLQQNYSVFRHTKMDKIQYIFVKKK